MQQLLLTATLMAGLLLGMAPEVWALTFVDTLNFGSPLTVTDSASGNDINFRFTHRFGPPGTVTVQSASLLLEHSGNADEGPVKELWSAYSGQGLFIGALSKSLKGPTSDLWEFSDEVLKEFFSEPSTEIEFALAELTSYNGEKMDLYRSVLEVQYETQTSGPASPAGTSHPSAAPEPATALLLSMGLGFAGLKKISGCGKAFLRRAF
ncbi:PEP-CTERM sorting domain-containing protein [Omnitrophica bacterium]|nr:PEP-CTERM sorting domain-containing protein [Candidatus Omnitrophota bacterium]